MMAVRYRNEYVKKWSEKAAALRYRLQREDELHCDGYTTEETPAFEAGIPFEIKATKRSVSNGSDAGQRPGRWHLTLSSHERLLDASGYYVLIVYRTLELDDGGERMLIEEINLVSAEEIDPLIPDTGASVYRLSHARLASSEAGSNQQPSNVPDSEEAGA